MTWLPFDLHPEYPAEGLPRERLLARYGPEMTERMRAFFADRGLSYNPNPDVVPNSRRALQLAEVARDAGRHAEAHDRLMDAYWHEGQDIGDPEVLQALARELELPDKQVEQALAGDLHAQRIAASTAQAAALGVTGVPAFVLAERLLLLGAQPEEVFEQAFARLEAMT